MSTTTTYTTTTGTPMIGPASATYGGLAAIAGFIGLLELIKHLIPFSLATKDLIGIPAWLFAT